MKKDVLNYCNVNQIFMPEGIEESNDTYGDNKKYNHPTEEVLQRLTDANIQESNIYITRKQISEIYLLPQRVTQFNQTKQYQSIDAHNSKVSLK